jgi:hypothetical protein
LSASLTLGGQPVEIQQGQVLIRGTDGEVETLEMTPGLHTSIVWTPKSAGVYGIDMVVTGKAPDGRPIERTAFLAVEAQPAGSPEKATTNLSLLIAGVVLALGLGIYLLIRLIRRLFRRRL